ncbi:MAG: hypothetical protein ABEK02_00950 [Haloquadratum sp.]
MSVVTRGSENETGRCMLCRENRGAETHQGKLLCPPCVRRLRESDLIGPAPTAAGDEGGAETAETLETALDLADREGVERLGGNRYLIVIE